VNLFNYAGAVLGAVLLGLLADAPGLGVAFLLPAVLLVPILFVARRFRPPVPSSPEPPMPRPPLKAGPRHPSIANL